MNAIEPFGDAISGDLAARGLEPPTGTDQSGHTAEDACLNCGMALVGDYCHACGQHAHVHRSLSAFGHDLLHGVFHFEGRIWRTLPLLAWHPGELTRRYIEGQRASFVGPLPLFLFTVFLMFAVVSWTTATSNAINLNLEKGMAELGEEGEAKLAKLEQQREAAAASGAPTAAIEKRIAEQKNDLSLAREIARNGASGAVARASDDMPPSLKPLNDAYFAAYLAAKKNPDLLLFKLKSNGYKYSWALIPLSLPLMWLLFPFARQRRMYDHTVFVTYSLSFMTLLVIAGSVYRLTSLPGTGLLLLVPPIHMYRQLRGAYDLSRPSALWRAAALVAGSFTIIVLFGIGLVLTGLLD
jgi:hypothetical protein